MNNNQLNNKYRYERKFIINNPFIDSLDLIRNFFPLEINEIYSERRINSLYYDTDDYEFANQNIEGFSNRYKIRVRYYGVTKSFLDPVLEIKSKKGFVGSKYKIALNKFDLQKNMFSLSYMLNDINFPINLRDILLLVKPKLFVSYTRKYYESNCGKYRFTFDKNITFKGTEHADEINNFETDVFQNYLNRILEIKYNNNENFAHLLDIRFPFRLTANSKYLVGLNYLGLIS